MASGRVIEWGVSSNPAVVATLTNVVAISGGYEHELALRDDGTVAAWGYYLLPNQDPNFPTVPATVPAGLSNVVAVAAGKFHSLALKADGSVVAWGTNVSGQLDVPSGLTNVVGIAAGLDHSLALGADGTVVAWGANDYGQSAVPDGLSNVVAIAAGAGTSFAVKADRSLVGWGGGTGSLTNMPPGLTNVVGVAAGNDCLALLADGSVTGWGWSGYTVPPGVTNIIAVSAGMGGGDNQVDLVLKSDGTVAGWGFLFAEGGPQVVPDGLSNVVAIAAGSWGSSLALMGQQPPLVLPPVRQRRANIGGTVEFRANAICAQPMGYQWRFNGADIPGATDAVLILTDVQPSQAGSYSVAIANPYGSATSGEMTFQTVPILINGQPQDQLAIGGGSAAFSVVAKGVLPLTYQWKWNGQVIAGATNSTLALADVQLDQAGEYSVTVSNAYGAASSTAGTLTVAPFLICSQPQDAVTFNGGSAAFSVSVNATPPLNYQWQFNGQELKGATEALLTLRNAQPSQAGSYSARISNSYGMTNSAKALLRVVPIAAWGSDPSVQAAVPDGLTDVVAIAAAQTDIPSSAFYLALQADGQVVAWGDDSYGQTDVPPEATNVISIAAGADHNLALRADGTVLAWGYDGAGVTAVPAGLSHVVAIAAGGNLSLALKADGTVAAWGYSGSTRVPRTALDVVAIAAGLYHGVALRADGTVVAWGGHYPDFSQTNMPPGLTNVVAIAAGSLHSAALRSDGAVIPWGGGNWQALPQYPGIVSVAVGDAHMIALRADGSVVRLWGSVSGAGAPAGLTNALTICAGGGSSLAVVNHGALILGAPLTNPTWDTNGFSVSLPTQTGHVYRLEYKQSLSESNWTALPLVPGTGRIRTLTDPTAGHAERFYRVRRW